MTITLYTNNDEKNKLNKTLSDGLTLTGTLRDECSIERPVILIDADNITEYNYFYIEEFDRYYFRTALTSVRNGLWRLEGKTDVLMSFKDAILASNVILRDSETTGANNYAAGNQWQTLVKTKTDIINFPSGLLDEGEFILITAGG